MPYGAVPFPFGHCRICQDKATGFHYGVATCEGCKGFFKRSIPKGDKYTCFFGGQCNITPFNRNRCKACRFKRCLDNGMAIDAVKMGRIPQVEKERALLEAGLQTQPQSNMNVDTEESVSSVSLSHSEWMISDLAQDSHVEKVTTGAPGCERSLEWNILTSQCRENNITLGGQVSSASEWNNPERKGLLLKYNDQQPMLNSMDTGFDRNDASMQTHQHTPGSVKTHKEELPEISNSLNEKTSAFSTLSLSSPISTKYENQFCSSVGAECCNELSYKGQLSARLKSNTQDKTSFPQHSRTVVDSSILKTATTQTEPRIYDYKSAVHCHNPFSESSVSFRHQEITNSSYAASLADMTSSTVFDEKPGTFSIEPGVERDCFVEHMESEMYTAANMTTQGSSYKGFKCKKSTLGEADVGNISRGDNQFDSKTKVYRKSCYSPDVIKVLMDQVGEDRINGMKQQIMTTIAKTFGPDEYEATAQLLTSYTQFSGQQEDTKSNPSKQPYNNGQHNFSSISECTESIIFNSSPQVSTQHPNSNTLSLTTHYEQDFSPLTISSHQILTEHSQDFTKLSPTFPDLKSEHPSRLLHSYSEQMESSILKQEKDFKLSYDLNSAQDSVTSIEVEDMEFQVGQNAMDTTECCFSSNVCPPADLSGHFFPEEYDSGSTRSSDKASVSSDSQNSSSDKVSSISLDSSILNDLTMAVSALALSAAYDKHMPDIARKYKRMLDHIHNKKVIPFHPLTPEGKAKVYSNLIASIPNINKSIIGFSHDVPGFVSLPKEDKEILMKRGYYDIWMLTNSKFFYGDESYLQFDDGTFYTRALMETILNDTIVQKFIAFAKKLNNLALSDLEIAVLCAIQLTSVSHEPLDLSYHEIIQQINSHFVDLLVQEVSKQHPGNCSRILVDIFRLIPDLSEINLLQREIIANFSINEPPEKVEYKPKIVPLADISETDLAALTDS